MSDHISSNILDRRGTGCYKTTEAIEQLNTTVAGSGIVVYVMLSYDNLAEIEKRITAPNIVIFRGRPQPGMCVLHPNTQKISKYIRPKFRCHSCPEQFGCRYREQRITVEHLRDSEEGFAVLTVPENLKHVLKLIGKRLSLVIIDDVSLAKVVLPGEKVEKASVITAFSYLEPYPNLSTVSKMLLDRDQDPKSIVKHIRSIQKAFREELDQISIRVEEDVSFGVTPPDLRYLFELENAGRVVINDPVDKANIKIYSDLTKQLKTYRVRYLNATPSQGDLEAMKWLGPCNELADLSTHRDNWIVLQLKGAKYTKQSLLDSKPLESKISQITSSVEKQLTFINRPLLYMTAREANKRRFNDFFTEKYPNLRVEFVDFHSSRSYGTNDFRDYPVSIIVGAPSKPPSAFCHPCYDNLRKSAEEITKESATIRERKEQAEREGNKPFIPPIYPVSRDVTDTGTKNSIIQMIGRNLREGDNVDRVKIAIVITDIGLADETGHIPENGAKVEQFDSIGKLTARLKELVKVALDSQVMDEIFRQIDIRLTLGETVGLSQSSKDYHEQTGVSERRIKKGLELRYNLCEIMNAQNKPTKILQFKQGMGQVASSQPVLI